MAGLHQKIGPRSPPAPASRFREPYPAISNVPVASGLRALRAIGFQSELAWDAHAWTSWIAHQFQIIDPDLSLDSSIRRISDDTQFQKIGAWPRIEFTGHRSPRKGTQRVFAVEYDLMSPSISKRESWAACSLNAVRANPCRKCVVGARLDGNKLLQAGNAQII